jgi:hypothetical protein
MAYDDPEARQGGRHQLYPMQIAHNPLLNVREKLELLERLKAEASGAEANVDDIGFSPEEIEQAVAEVHARAESGLSEEPPIRGIF